MKKKRHQKSRFKLSLITTTALLFTVGIIASCTKNSAEAKPEFIYKNPPKAGVVAKINGKEITEEELIGDARLSFHDLKKREYDLKMKQLKKLLEEKLIGEKAKAAGMSTSEFIEKKVLKGGIKVSKKEYDAFVKEKKIPAAQINDALKKRIEDYLKESKREEKIEAYIAKLTKNDPVEVYFTKPKLQMDVAVGGAPTWGKENAKVTIIEFSDFQCPYCAKAAETVEQIKKEYKGKVRIAFKHFPLPMHKEAVPAAEASMCVHEQDSAKFWKFHDIAFKNMRNLDDASIVKYAKQVGADEKKFKECFEGKKYKKFVQDDMAYGDKLGVRSTPTFFVNGQLISGALPFDQFAEVIDEELKSAK